MKALIIDDEPPVITVVRMLVDWDSFRIDTVLSCSSSEAALEILGEEQPEIILSDVNLPGLSGLDLVERLRKQGSNAQVILISAYDKFSYAQRAMQLDCVEYLLKPIDRETVNRAVAKAVNKYKEATGFREDSGRIKAQNLFSAFLSSPKDTGIFDELAEAAPWIKINTKCRLGVVSLQHLLKEGATRFDMQSSVSEYVFQNRLGVATAWGDSSDIVILFSGGNSDEIVCVICKEMLRRLRQESGVILHAGISDEAVCPAGISDAYRQALDLAVSCNLCAQDVTVQTRLAALPPITSLLWIDKVLFAVLSERNINRLQDTLRELSGHLDRAGIVTTRQLENFRAMYNSQRSKWILARQKEQGMTVHLPNNFSESFCLANGRFLAEHFREVIFDDLMMLQQTYLPEEESISTAELCRRARAFLEENYSEDISLEGLARRLGISQSYLSRSFKKETGMSPIDYLTQCRINEACRMLTGFMRTVDIAAAVGLADPKYFSRVFKKVKGMSPSEYRDLVRKREFAGF